MLTWKSKKNENGKKYWLLNDEEDQSEPILILFCNEQSYYIAKAKNVRGQERVLKKPLGHESRMTLAQAKDAASGWLFYLQMND